MPGPEQAAISCGATELDHMLFVGKGFNRRNFLVCKSDGEAAFSGQS